MGAVYMPNFHTLAVHPPGGKADLLDKIWMKVKPEDKIETIITSVINLTQNSLNTLASTLLVVDNKKKELYFHILLYKTESLKNSCIPKNYWFEYKKVKLIFLLFFRKNSSQY